MSWQKTTSWLGNITFHLTCVGTISTSFSKTTNACVFSPTTTTTENRTLLLHLPLLSLYFHYLIHGYACSSAPQFNSDTDLYANIAEGLKKECFNMADTQILPSKDVTEHIDNHEEEGNDEVLRRFQVLLWLVGSRWLRKRWERQERKIQELM